MAPAIGRGIGQSFAPAYPHFVTRGLVALYDFIQGADSQVLYDISGNGNGGQLGSTTGVDTNDPTWTSVGLDFDGTDDFAHVEDGEGPMARLTTLTVLGVAKQVVNATNQTIAAIDLDWRLQFTNTGAYRVLAWDGDGSIGQVTSANGVITLDTWYFTELRRDGGAIRGRVNLGNAISTTIDATASAQLARPTRIGVSGSLSSPAEFLNGDLALVVFYNVALTDTEIAQNYRAAQHLMSLRGITI
jgi:hypothetical protein